MAELGDFVRDHFKISFDKPDKSGNVTATFSFVDMVALTKRVQAWCGKVVALMEASGPGLSIDADRALPLFLNGTAPEAAAVLLIAEARAADPAPAAAPDTTEHAPGYRPGLTYADGYRRGLADGRVLGRDRFRPRREPERESVGESIKALLANPAISQDERQWLEGFATQRAKLHAELEEARRAFENDPTDSGWEWLSAVKARIEAVPGATVHRAPVEAADAHRAAAWEGTDLVTHLRSWPAAPPDTDAFSAAYAGDLMQKAADEIERLRVTGVRTIHTPSL